MRAVIMRGNAQLVGVGFPVVGEDNCAEIPLEPTQEYPLGYGSGTCMCGEVFDVYVRTDAQRKKASPIPFVRGSELALTFRSSNKVAAHTAKLVK